MLTTVPAEETAEGEVLFSVECPALKKQVVLLKETWYGHIINPKTGHPYMKSKKGLVQNAVQGIVSDKQFFRFSDCAASEWFADYACPDFEPLAKFLRVAFKRLDTGMIVVTSAYRQARGIISYEQSG